MARISRLAGWSKWLFLCLLLMSQAAWAQRVLVFTLEGDKKGKLRTQIVRALQGEEDLTLVPIASYEAAAKRAGFKGGKVYSSTAIARVAPTVGADLVVSGSVSRRAFSVAFIDSTGQEIYQRSLSLKNGLLTPNNADKLARAIATAVGTVQTAAPPDEGRGQELVIVPPDPKKVTPKEPTDRDVIGSGPPEPEEPTEPSRPTAAMVGPTTITLHLGGMTTWRSYCARPGVSSCAEFERLAEEDRPAGVSVLFNTPVPYAGFSFGLDLFPLARAGINGLQGLGVVGQYSQGYSLTEVNRRSDTGETEPQRVVSVDRSWMASLAYRFYFGLFSDERGTLPAYVGARAGLASRSFVVDPTANVGLTGSHRSFPQVSLDLSIPLIRQARIEAAGLFFAGPSAGKEELNSYGESVNSSGFGFEAGVAGELYGPIGYEIRFRFASFRDRYEGSGVRWFEGGAAEETYSSVFWGLTAGF